MSIITKYQKLKVIGSGSYGNAILVQHKITNVLYVVKEIILNDMNTNDSLKEVKFMNILCKHPNIVELKEYFIDKSINKLYIVMKYCDSGDLCNKINKRKNIGGLFTEYEILNYITQVFLGLKHIHDRKILYRDLKTQNIFLNSRNSSNSKISPNNNNLNNETVHLGDFGISKGLDATLSFAKTQIGTPYYLSPEICQGKEYSFATDIWSLGVVLYELCTLSVPFQGTSMQSLFQNILHTEPKPISARYGKFLHNLVSECLVKDPNKRITIHDILQKPELMPYIDSLMSDTLKRAEFDHTVLHGYNVNDKLKQPIDPSPNISTPINKPVVRKPIHAIEKSADKKSDLKLEQINAQQREIHRERQERMDAERREKERRDSEYRRRRDEEDAQKRKQLVESRVSDALSNASNKGKEKLIQAEEKRKLVLEKLKQEQLELKSVNSEMNDYNKLLILRRIQSEKVKAQLELKEIQAEEDLSRVNPISRLSRVSQYSEANTRAEELKSIQNNQYIQNQIAAKENRARYLQQEYSNPVPPAYAYEPETRTPPAHKIHAKSTQESEHLKMLEDARKQNYAERLALAAKLKAQQQLDLFGASPQLDVKQNPYGNVSPNLFNKSPSPAPLMKDEKEAKRVEYEENLANARRQMWEERIALKQKSSVYLAQDIENTEANTILVATSNGDEEAEIKLLTAQLTEALSDEAISAFVSHAHTVDELETVLDDEITEVVCNSIDDLEDAPAEDIAIVSTLLEDDIADDILPFNSPDAIAEAEKLIIQNTFLLSSESNQMSTIRPFTSVSKPISDDILVSTNNDFIPAMKSNPVPNIDLSNHASIFEVKQIKPPSPSPIILPSKIDYSEFKLPVPTIVSPPPIVKPSVKYDIVEKSASSKRIDSLKLYLERAIGLDCMVDSYMILHQAFVEKIEVTEPSIADPLSKLIPISKMKYIPLIQELIKLENE